MTKEFLIVIGGLAASLPIIRMAVKHEQEKQENNNGEQK